MLGWRSYRQASYRKLSESCSGQKTADKRPATRKSSRQSGPGGERCFVALGEKLGNPFSKKTQTIYFGHNRVHSDFFRARVVHGEEQDRNFGRDLFQLARRLKA